MSWFSKLFHRHRWFITRKEDCFFKVIETGELRGFTMITLECECGERKDTIYLHKKEEKYDDH